MVWLERSSSHITELLISLYLYMLSCRFDGKVNASKNDITRFFSSNLSEAQSLKSVGPIIDVNCIRFSIYSVLLTFLF